MIALARKYRPKNFATVAVQSHVSNTLKGAIARGRVAHGYLLCGPRGVGKTTLARVLAMALNCERKREDGEPCGACESCQRIWSGSASLDVVEIDAASNRGVDDARELRERAMYAPSGPDRFKVYIVDEAHMLTREAWNALLKVLEEPPPRVVFVFATTEPQKIAQAAAPVLSRLQRFDFRRMSTADVRERLQAVLKEEGVVADADALGMIARAADGSMRDGLSLTDQVLALGDGRVTAQLVRDALGLVAEDEYIGILDLILERRAGDVFGAVGKLVDAGVDLGQFLAGLSDMLRAFLAVSLGAQDVGVSDSARSALTARKEKATTGDVLRMLNAAAELEPNFRRSGQQQILLEALLVRFALLDRTIDLEALLRQVGGGGAPVDSRQRSTAAGAERGASPGGPPMRAEASSQATVMREPPAARAQRERSPDQSSARPTPSLSVEAVVESSAQRRPTPEVARPVSALDINSIVERWDDLVATIRVARPMLGALLEHALPTAVTANGVLTLQVDERHAFEGLSQGSKDLMGLLSPSIVGLSKVSLRGPEGGASAGPTRMTAESIKAESLAGWRKRDPIIRAAIDALDLDLVD